MAYGTSPSPDIYFNPKIFELNLLSDEKTMFETPGTVQQ
jgi:hypothetical protein